MVLVCLSAETETRKSFSLSQRSNQIAALEGIQAYTADPGQQRSEPCATQPGTPGAPLRCTPRARLPGPRPPRRAAPRAYHSRIPTAPRTSLHAPRPLRPAAPRAQSARPLTVPSAPCATHPGSPPPGPTGGSVSSRGIGEEGGRQGGRRERRGLRERRFRCGGTGAAASAAAPAGEG